MLLTSIPYFILDYQIKSDVSKGLPTNEVTKLSNFQEFVCLLLAPNEGLAYQFEVCQATTSNTVLKWLKLTDTRLSGLIHWPDRDALQKNHARTFQEFIWYKGCGDFSKIFIERPSNLLARAATDRTTNTTIQQRPFWVSFLRVLCVLFQTVEVGESAQTFN